MGKAIIIAEAGVNHNGDIELAKKMIEEAAVAGADYIKFQTFKAERLLRKNTEKAAYQKATTDETETQYEMIKRLELSESDFRLLKSHCEAHNIGFLSSPFDNESVDFLHALGVDFFKIPSGEIVNVPYLRQIGRTGKPVVLSTGMSTLGEIEFALDILRESGTTDIAVLHCNTEYPTPYPDVHLHAMRSIKHAFHTKVGYSDHTIGIEVPIAAIALGAEIIEKHFTLDKDLPGPDHAASVSPEELKRMVEAIRNTERALGKGIKRRSPSESANITAVRKSIVAAANIQKGQVMDEDHLATMRPGSGVSPILWDLVVGSTAHRDYSPGDMIEFP